MLFFKKNRLLYILIFFISVFNINSQEVDGVTSATKTLFTRFIFNSFESGTEYALMRSDLEVVVKSINRVFKNYYPFGLPIKEELGKITVEYNRNSFTGYGFLLNSKTDVISTGGGLVVQKESFDNKYGNIIVIQHDNGFFSMYGGLDNTFVNEGQKIIGKEIIGDVFPKEDKKYNLFYGIYHATEWDPSLNEFTLSFTSLNPYEFVNN